MLVYGILGNINAKGIEKDGFRRILGKKKSLRMRRDLLARSFILLITF